MRGQLVSGPADSPGQIRVTPTGRADMIGAVTLFVISGVSAAGKSTVARLLAQRFPRGVCVPGDAIRAMIASGRVDMRPGAGKEALRQLALRYAGALSVAGVFLGLRPVSRPDLVGTAWGDGAGFVGEDDGLDAVAQAKLRQ